MDYSLLAGARYAATNGADKLIALVNPKGKFIYQYNDDNTPIKKPEYNLLRHCGAVWALLTTHEIFPEETLSISLNSAQTALHWLLFKYIKSSKIEIADGTATSHVVWHGHVKLGGNALALLAISQFVRALIKNQHSLMNTFTVSNYWYWVTEAEKLACGIHQLFVFKDEITPIYHKVKFPELTPTDFISEYYDGEALFALGHWKHTCQLLSSICNIKATEYASYLRYPVILQTLHKFAAGNYGVTFQSHWVLYAVSQAIITGDMPEILVPYMNNLVQDILARPEYRQRQQSTPTACRSEGLLAALQAYQHLNLTDLQPAIIIAIEENIKQQLQFTRIDGAVLKGVNSQEVRIDYIQHNISAFANYVKLCS